MFFAALHFSVFPDQQTLAQAALPLDEAHPATLAPAGVDL
jgi:hypothetical protein